MRRVFSDPIYTWRVSLVASALEAEGIAVHVDGMDIGAAAWPGMSGSPSVWVPDDTDEALVRVVIDRVLAEHGRPDGEPVGSTKLQTWLLWIALALVASQLVAYAFAF